jgi:hypothetical protein
LFFIGIRYYFAVQYQIPLFAINEDFDGFHAQFLKTDLGKIYLSTPFSALAHTFKLKDSKKVTCCFFSPKGKIALMMLKNYYGCSDKKLIELLNGNIFMQFFCDILIPIDKPLKSFKIVSPIRMEFSIILNIRKAQETLAKSWIPYMNDLDKLLIDATCYESEVRFPTDQKLLWECVQWNYKQMVSLCWLLKIKLPRTKYLDWCKRYHQYSRRKRKLSKHRTKISRGLLKLL